MSAVRDVRGQQRPPPLNLFQHLPLNRLTVECHLPDGFGRPNRRQQAIAFGLPRRELLHEGGDCRATLHRRRQVANLAVERAQVGAKRLDVRRDHRGLQRLKNAVDDGLHNRRAKDVTREIVFEDYLLSNSYGGTVERVAATARDRKVSPDEVRPLLMVDRSYSDR